MVHYIKLGEVSLFSTLNKASELFADEVSDSHLDVNLANKRGKLVDVRLIIKELAFFFNSMDSLELTSNNSVSYSDR
jgi:hypothetical protein